MNRLEILHASPHRLPFLAGSLGFAGLALWWLAQMLYLHFGEFPFFYAGMPQTELPPSLLHGPAMLYLAFAPFIFGFLLTVFPRWMSLPDIPASRYVWVSGPIFLGVVVALAGLWSGLDVLVLAGFALAAAGWLVAVMILLGLLRRNAREGGERCWHAWSACAALILGLAGLLSALAFLQSWDSGWLTLANRIGMGGFLLPIFLTVAHRMIPFFAGNAVKGYVRWRPDWLLAILWLLLLARLGGELLPHEGLRTSANTGLALVTALMCSKWWPRGAAPGLLKVLLWGFAWAPAGFALAVIDGLLVPLGRGPDHALLIGFSGSLMIAMVTRVTQGHSGRPLEMNALAWTGFFAVQLAAVSRIIAALRFENGTLLAIAAAVFAAGLLPWLIRNAAIYLSPRSDGKPG